MDFQKNGKDKYDVYVIWSSNGDRRRVYTPTGNGNEKVPMTVKDISQIDIDHVKPIDQTLRDLGDKKKLPNLERVSDQYKSMLEAFSQEGADESKVENKTLKDLEDVDINALYNELELIRKDGLLRLMSSSYNQRKSNSSAYTSIIKNKKDGYLGLLGEAIMDDNDEPLYLYQKLSESNKTRATTTKPKGRKQAMSKALIDYI